MAEFKEDSKFAEISFGLFIQFYISLMRALTNIHVFTVASEEEEEIICQEGGTPEDAEFDKIVGAIEDILLDEEFSAEQNGFCSRHCGKQSSQV